MFSSVLFDSNPNMVQAALQRIMSKSQLFGRSLDLVEAIAKSVLRSKDGAKAVVDAVHKLDALAVVKEVYSDFTSLLSVKRADKQSFRSFKLSFQPQVARINSHFSTSTFLTRCMLSICSEMPISTLDSECPFQQHVHQAQISSSRAIPPKRQ